MFVFLFFYSVLVEITHIQSLFILFPLLRHSEIVGIAEELAVKLIKVEDKEKDLQNSQYSEYTPVQRIPYMNSFNMCPETKCCPSVDYVHTDKCNDKKYFSVCKKNIIHIKYFVITNTYTKYVIFFQAQDILDYAASYLYPHIRDIDKYIHDFKFPIVRIFLPKRPKRFLGKSIAPEDQHLSKAITIASIDNIKRWVYTFVELRSPRLDKENLLLV